MRMVELSFLTKEKKTQNVKRQEDFIQGALINIGAEYLYISKDGEQIRLTFKICTLSAMNVFRMVRSTPRPRVLVLPTWAPGQPLRVGPTCSRQSGSYCTFVNLAINNQISYLHDYFYSVYHIVPMSQKRILANTW